MRKSSIPFSFEYKYFTYVLSTILHGTSDIIDTNAKQNLMMS
jgi:hypothetical protein